jgi:hypothetical protein
MAVYTQTNLKDNIFDSTLDADISNALTVQDLMNRAARIVNSEVDLRSAKRKAALSPKLFDDQYDYTCPTDMKDVGVIDLVDQADRRLDSRWQLTTQEQFDRKKTIQKNLIAFADDDLVRKIRVSADINDTVIVVSSLDSLSSGGGTWTLFGDAENVAVNTNNFVQGIGSIGFDISGAGGTTAGIQNTSLTTFDVTDYKDNGSAFVWVYINSTTNLTNFILRLGSDSSNYYSMTATTTNEGVAFVAGWNLLRFDFSGKSTTGTPDDDGCDYAAIYMTKAGAKTDDGYRFDYLTLHTGEYHDIVYYSKYGWVSNAGVYKENSTTSTDLLNCDTEEFDLFVYKGKEIAAADMKDWNAVTYYEKKYLERKAEYQKKYKTERKRLEFNYY